MLLNTLISLVVISLTAMILLVLYKKRSKTARDYLSELEGKKNLLSEEALLDYVKEAMNEQTRESLLDKGYSDQEYDKQRAIRNKLKIALRSCKHGHIKDKEVVKDHIYHLLADYIGDDINGVIAFNRDELLDHQDKFDILLYVYKVILDHGYKALEVMIKDNGFDQEKKIIEKGQTISYMVTKEEVDKLFDALAEEIEQLSYRDKLLIITQRIYQRFKGLGVVDEIRDMEIDGVSGGVSGELGSAYLSQTVEEYIHNINHVPKSFDSVWVMVSGKSINLSFLSFGSEGELRRVCQNIYSYNKAGQLSESTGYKINEMKDGSRVVVVRPPFAESWAFFVRKFNLSDKSLNELINDDKVIDCIQFLIKGARIISITGSQGSGKTTLLMAMVKSIYATLPLRVQETAFELHLRNIYPRRNILTFKETSSVSGQDGLDIQKKTDGAVNILGEVATDPVASWMIQMAQVASLFTLFTHHAKTASDLVLALRNSMLRTKTFSNEKIAEEQVASVLNYDIHLEKDTDGKRYISRITEINVVKDQDYKQDFNKAETMLDATKAFYSTQTEYFRRMTDRQTFETRDIIRYDNGSYEFVHKFSKENISLMKEHMNRSDGQLFDAYLMKVWGT